MQERKKGFGDLLKIKERKTMMNNNIKSMELKDDELELVSGGRRMHRALNSKVWMDDSLGRRGWMDDNLGRRGRSDSAPNRRVRLAS